MVSFVGILYFSRELGATTLGVFFLFQALSGIFTVVANLGTREAIEKRMSEGSDSAAVLSTGILIKIAILAVISVFILIFSRYINDYIGMELAVLVVFAVIAQEFGHLAEKVLNGELRVSDAAVLPLVNRFAWITTGIVFVAFGYGVYGLVYGVIAGFTAKFLVGWYRITTPLGTPSMEIGRSLWSYAKYTIVPSLDEYVHNWTDILVMGFFLSSAAVGAYEISWRILTPIFVLSSAVGLTIFPQISAWDAQQETGHIEQTIPKAIVPSLILIIPAFFGAAALSTEILGLLFGEGFEAASLALPVLIAALVPRALREIAGKVLQGLDQPRFVNISSVIDIVANIVLNVLFIIQFGLIGAAVATGLSYTLGAVIRWYYLAQFITIRVPYREVGWCVLSAAGMYFIISIVHSRVAITTIPQLFAIVGLAVVVYGCLVIVYEPLRDVLFNYANRLLPPSIQQAL